MQEQNLWTIISNILAGYAFLQIIIRKYIITKHDKRMKNYPYLLSGGTPETWDSEQAAIEYSKTRWYKFVTKFLEKIF